MNIFQKIMTALRGSVREIGESVVDANGTRIYSQEVEDARQHLVQAKQDLTLVMAKEMQADREIERLQKAINSYESNGVDALNQGREDLAVAVSEKIAELEVELDGQRQAKQQFAEHVLRLKSMIKQADKTIRDHERELTIVQTTESVQKATQSISQSVTGGSSKLLSAKESLERIKKRQQETADRMKAGEMLDEEMGDRHLEKQLQAAGIGENSDRKKDILSRLRAEQAKQRPPLPESIKHDQLEGSYKVIDVTPVKK